jgi:hypothetical protein
MIKRILPKFTLTFINAISYYFKALSLFLFCVALLNSVILADPQVDYLITQAKNNNLASHPDWLSLLHYTQSDSDSKVSDITSSNFFLSPTGRTSPEAELIATIRSFFEKKGDNDNLHSTCQFIARYNWIKSQVDISSLNIPKTICTNFNQWLPVGDIRSTSLIFVSSSFGNPATFFGHILLRFNIEKNNHGNMLLNPTINFGAIVPPKENSLSYFFNGVFGFYAGRYTIQKFYAHNHMYGEVELRDLWEYVLNLNPEQTKRLAYHTWELLNNVDFKYYFFKENCAFRFAKLLEYVLDSPILTAELSLWTIPVNVFYPLKEIEVDGKPLIKEVRFHPSRQRRLINKIDRFDSSEKEWVVSIFNSISVLDSVKFKSLILQKKIKILDALIDYFQYKIIDDPTKEELKSQKRLVLFARSRLGLSKKEEIDSRLLKDPTLGTKPASVRLGVAYNEILGSSVELGVRSSYHDFLGQEDGYLPNSHLTTLDLRIRANHNQVYLQKLDLVKIQKFGLSPTGISSDKDWSWRFNSGFVRKDYSGVDNNVFETGFGMGTTIDYNSNFDVFYGFLSTFFQIQALESKKQTLGLMPIVGMTLSADSYWKSNFELKYKQSIRGEDLSEPVFSWRNRFSFNSNWDLRFEYEYHQTSEVLIAANIYW